MSTLFAETYPDTAEGRATMALASVATTVDATLGMKMAGEELTGVLVEMHRINRNDLPEDLHRLYDQLRSHLGID